MKFTVAAAQYPLDQLESWDAYEAKLTRWCEEAKDGGAALAVFPEYGGMELAALDPATMGDLGGSLAAVSALVPRVDALHTALSARLDLHILAASLPCAVPGGASVNRARLFIPNGKTGIQDKLIMTRFEREDWGVSGGGPLRLFVSALGKIGVNICYDSEFPLLARAQCEAGMDLLLVPSCTETTQGYHRVRLGAQARALEGQCHAVHSATVGLAEWSPAVDKNHGAAAVYGPPDHGFPADGVVALGEMDAAQWLFAEIDTARTADLRGNGTVLNHRDWAEQPGAAPLPPVEVVDLR